MQLEEISRGFWRTPDGRFDVLRTQALVTRPGVIYEGTASEEHFDATVSVTRYVVYDCDLGRRHEFGSFDAARGHVEYAYRQPAA